jgi:hypothetical protein
MQRGEGEDDDERCGLGPVWRRKYWANAGKHGRFERGRVGREPRDGQDALDFSVPAKPTSAVRVGIDYELREFIVLRFEALTLAPMLNGDTFHGQEMKNAFIRHGMADRRGRIL